MNPNIKRQLAVLFLVLLIPVGLVTVLGVWDILTDEYVRKSLLTLLVIGVFLAVAISILSFVDVEHPQRAPKKKKKINEFHKD